MKPFKGKNTPNIIDLAFGSYYEAYFDRQGKLSVCAKGTMYSVKVNEMPNGVLTAHRV